jgi:sulfite oxidase
MNLTIEWQYLLFLEGYAWSGGGQKIVRVDVTADGGKVWHVAHFTGQDTKSRPPYHWGWTLWKAEIPIPSGEKQVHNIYFILCNNFR